MTGLPGANVPRTSFRLVLVMIALPALPSVPTSGILQEGILAEY
jgi:hypothetical protein